MGMCCQSNQLKTPDHSADIIINYDKNHLNENIDVKTQEQNQFNSNEEEHNKKTNKISGDRKEDSKDKDKKPQKKVNSSNKKLKSFVEEEINQNSNHFSFNKSN